MMRRRVLLIGLLSTVAGVTIGAWMLWPPHPVITRESFETIDAGMTLGEVETILGGPGEFDENGDPMAGLGYSVAISKGNEWPWLRWDSERASIWIQVDAGNRVVGRCCQSRPAENPVDMLRRCLHL